MDKIPKEVAIGFVLGFNNDKNITPEMYIDVTICLGKYSSGADLLLL